MNKTIGFPDSPRVQGKSQCQVPMWVGVNGDGIKSECNENKPKVHVRGLNGFTILVLFVAIVGGLLFGLDIGTAAITSMNSFREEMGIPLLEPGVIDSPSTTQQLSLFTVIFHASTLIGAPFAGALSDRFGRKPVILIACSAFGLGAVWQALAGLLSSHFAWSSIILGRVLGGIGNGFVLTIMPVYASELSPQQYRGKVITLFQFNIAVGIFLMSVFNSLLDKYQWGWRVGFAVQCIPCLVIILLTLFALPESPRYLMRRCKFAKAQQALARLCKGDERAEEIVTAELDGIQQEIESIKTSGEGTFSELFQGGALPTTLCALMIAFSQNITGVNWFMNYATQLFSSLGFQPFAWDLAMKSVFMLSTLVALCIIERFGRKFLAVWGTLLIILAFALGAIVIQATGVDIRNQNPSQETVAVQYFALSMIFFFQLVFAITWGPLGWLVPAEVFPLRLRGKGMSLAVVANMLTNIIVGDYGYVSFNSITSTQATMFLLAVLNCTIALTTVVCIQPETKGISLEDMRKVFGYEIGGNEIVNHGTMREFFHRNFKQTQATLLCRPVDPKVDIELRFPPA